MNRLSEMLATLKSVLKFRPIETDPVARRIARAASVADLRKMARRRLPRGVFDYIDGAAEDERSLASNSDAYGRIEFRPRVLRDVSGVDTTTTLLGRPLPFPLVLAPTGFTRIADSARRARGRTGRGARRAPVHAFDDGTRSIEEVAAVSDGRSGSRSTCGATAASSRT